MVERVAAEVHVLRNGRLPDGRVVDVHIEAGRIFAVEDSGPEPPEGASSEDLAGWLLLPALAEPHAHLDKALTSERVPNPTGDLMGAIDAWLSAAAAGMFTHEDTVERATAAMKLLLVHGVTAVRSHVNVAEEIGTSAVEAVVEARDRMAGLIDVEIVALTATPMTGPEGAGNRAALLQALDMGADLVGGCPHLDPDGPELIRNALTVAADAGVGIDLHVDEMLDPTVLTLRELARQVTATGFEHGVTASHCVTLGMQEPDVQRQVAEEVGAAGISVVPLPQTNLYLQGRDHPRATPRGLAPIQVLVDAGVLVAAGADNVQDPFNLVGRSDPLETAALLVMAGHLLPDDAFRLVSNDVRETLGMERVSIQIGSPADLLAIDAPSIRGAIADAPMSRRVFRQGRLVASADQTTTVFGA
jgi:cytosine deaminase